LDDAINANGIHGALSPLNFRQVNEGNRPSREVRIAGVQGHQGRLGLTVAVETETPPAVVRLDNRSTERSALEFLRSVEVVGPHRDMPNPHKPTLFSLAAP